MILLFMTQEIVIHLLLGAVLMVENFLKEETKEKEEMIHLFMILEIVIHLHHGDVHMVVSWQRIEEQEMMPIK